MTIGKGLTRGLLTDDDIRNLLIQAFTQYKLDGKKVIVLTPDSTRTAPVGKFFRLFHELLGTRVKQLDFLIALGTHQAMTEEQINKLFDLTPAERKEKYPRTRIFNHEWDKPGTFTTIGTISADEIAAVTDGLFREAVPVSLNKLIFEYDQIIILGPTFPHEVIGFSGGNKYFFPGIAAAEIINFTHWLGAIITNPAINGTKYTPVRKVVDKAASFIKIPKLCCSLVTTHAGLHGLYIDTPEAAYEQAADLSAQIHITYCAKPYKRILSMAPAMYDDLWTAGKCMYKLEPVVADGGELIIYAPHVTEVSYTHGKILDRIGYHVRDYFRKQMDKFKDVPRGVMAHSTHVRGTGTYEDGVEKPRVTVTLATGIPEERCKKINLGYLHPDKIHPCEWQGREEEGILLVRNAGEILHKIR
jgi:nickel-dependent lactate racemase